MKSAAEIQFAASGMRLLWLGVLMAAGFVFLAYTLYGIQIRDTRSYASAQETHIFRRVRLPATRGKILDCCGRVLADNRPSFCASFYIEEMREPGPWSNTINRVDQTIEKLGVFLNSERKVSKNGIWTHIRRRRAIPLVAFQGLDDRAVAKFSENCRLFPGVDITVQSERVYPFGDSACHVIGYVGKGQPKSQNENGILYDGTDFDFLLPDLTGRDGIEKSCDAALAGMCGGELIQINVVGYKHDSFLGQAPVPGRDIRLTLDMRLQQVAEKALEGNKGAVVVVNCRTGELPVLASSPRYDLSLFAPSLGISNWDALLNDPDKPLYSRAAAGVYPPGSVFKPLVAISALKNGCVNPEFRYDCPGYTTVGNRRIRCAHRMGHGRPINMAEAIEESCNPYFIEIGRKTGWEPNLMRDAADAGFGSAPNLEIFTAAGVLPSDEWKRKRFHDGWRGGDTANVSIGQGFLAATPLQIAMFMAALANGGTLLNPRLVLNEGEAPGHAEPHVVRNLGYAPEDLAVIRRGMYNVINSPRGTGRRAAIPEVKAAGKTGTAEYMSGGDKKKNAWMAAFAPFENPEYAFVAMVEDSDAGGRSAAAVLRNMLSAVFVPGWAPEPTPYLANPQNVTSRKQTERAKPTAEIQVEEQEEISL